MVDRFGYLAASGATASSNFPVRNAEQPANAGGRDCFFGVFSPLVPGQSAAPPPPILSFYGGPGGDTAYAVMILFGAQPNEALVYLGGTSVDRADNKNKAFIAYIVRAFFS